MKILNVNFYKQKPEKHNKNYYNLKLKPQLKYDTVCFRGTDLLDLPEQEVMKRIQESVNYKYFIGQGTEAEVYRIKDSNYCVRIPYISSEMYNYNYSKDLSSIDKINHVRAKLGYGAAILDYFYGVTPKEYKNNIYSRNIFQEKISQFPLKSYTELLHQIAKAIDNEMIFDFSGGNLIVDLEKQKMTAIDFYNISDKPRPIKPLCEMYSVLTCYGTEEKTGRKIFNKIFNTSLEEFKPNIIPCMDVELFDFVDLVMVRNKDASFKTKDITKEINNFLELREKISQTVKSLKDIKKREIIDKNNSPLLVEKIKNMKKLLAKVL